jgi:hypothetical protein
MTLCKDCRFFYERKRSMGYEARWYDQFCKASPRERVVNPVTGVQGYAGTNDVGGSYITDEPYKHARDINTGDCQLWEPLGWQA